ncbi:DUF5801 repeats-in-toxin domain-containing protein, partial [Delftia sp. zbq_16]|uniref:DUF5801 repeats-in-toxin domain-containing protein n=1 Tax=Delftia sp. zbq_16 TaxID=3414429 RepID=UPI003C2B61FB
KTKYELTLNLAQGATEVDSGLDATAGGNIMLSKEAGTGDILGIANGVTVFRIHMDGSTGDLSLTQYKAIKHTDVNNNHDFLAQISAGLVGAKVTVYDKDGDSATSDTLDLGSVLGFEDDGPAVTSFGFKTQDIKLFVDESVGTTGSVKDEGAGQATNNDETAVGAPVGALGYATISGTNLFSLVVDAGQDLQDTS